MNKIIGIVSLKGGVGKTTTAVNLSAALTKMMKRTIIIDANFLSPSLHIYLGLLNPEITLKEIIEQDKPINQAIYEHKTGIHIIPGNFYENINFEKFKEKIESLKKDYDYIILDSGPSYGEEINSVLKLSDEVILIANPDYLTINSTLKAKQIANQENTKIRGIIMNRRKNKYHEIKSKEIEKTSDLKVIKEINEDSKISKSLSEFMPVVHHYPRNNSSRRFIELGKEIIKDEEKEIKDDDHELIKLIKKIIDE